MSAHKLKWVQKYIRATALEIARAYPHIRTSDHWPLSGEVGIDNKRYRDIGLRRASGYMNRFDRLARVAAMRDDGQISLAIEWLHKMRRTDALNRMTNTFFGYQAWDYDLQKCIEDSAKT